MAERFGESSSATGAALHSSISRPERRRPRRPQVRAARVVHDACFSPQTVARPDFADVIERYYRRWDTTIAEDNAACKRQQKGLNSPVPAAGGRYCFLEMMVHKIDNWTLDRVLGVDAR